MSAFNPLPARDRVRIPRQEPLEREAGERARDFGEVSLGFDEERALVEASRCLECPKPACIEGCPVGIDIRGFIRLVLQRDWAGALALIEDANVLPAVCGRVCPQESQCEACCLLGKKYAPVAIGKLERYVAERGAAVPPAPPAARLAEGARVAVVGSGPAGLTCAAELARHGYRVTVLEALHAAGGVLRYGIPEFRLPREVLDREVRRVVALGVELRTNVLVGRTVTVDELFGEWGFDAVFLATGAGTPTFLGIPGESLSGVYSANEFLTRVNLMHADRFPAFDTPLRMGREVAVVGGGNTAMDAVRTARRLGAERAYLVYRRSREEMPARVEEVHHAEQEGVEFLFHTNPLRIVGDGAGWVTALECCSMAPGERDASGRRRPIPVPGSERLIPVQTVIEAIGQKPNPIIQSTTQGLRVLDSGVVVVGPGQDTGRPGVFAGGDLSRGGATVILAMRDGRQAAAAIDAYLRERRAAAPGEASEAVSGTCS
jgi:glutamate synthase (NADPH/NADH) small chain